MIADHLIALLRCPQDGTPLERADQSLLDRVNRRIASGTLVNLAGKRVERPLEGGLLRQTGDLLYPIVDHIPVMLPDEAIDVRRVP